MKINNLDKHPQQYVVVADGFGDGTFPECWGTNAEYDYRALESHDGLPEALAAAEAYRGAGAKVFDRAYGKLVGKERTAAYSS